MNKLLILLAFAALLVASTVAHGHKWEKHKGENQQEQATTSTDTNNNPSDTENTDENSTPDNKGDDDDKKGDDDDNKGWHSKGKWGHHKHHNGQNGNSCHFQNDKSTYDLRLLMRDMSGKDWELLDQQAKTTYLFNPCKPVTDARCPEDSSLCAVGEKDIGVSFGMASQKQWAEVENGVEISYAGGEMCSNGVPRKTVMQLLCSQPNADQATHKTVLTEFKTEDCMVTASITSPYGCPVEQLCSVYGKPECEASEGLCDWKEDKCVHSTSNCVKFGRHHLSVGALLGIVVGTSALALCGLGACLCLCCLRRRRALKRRALPTTASKTAKQAEVEEQALEMPSMTSVVYQPMQQMGVPFPQMYNPLVFQTRDGMVQFMPSTSVQNE